MMPAAPARAANEQTFTLPRQPLESALRALAQASGNQVLFREGDTAGRQSRPLSGRHSVKEALEIVLRGSDLVARQVAINTFVIEPAPRPARKSRQRVQPTPSPAPPRLPERDEPPALTEILVTARHFSESIQTAPVAVSQLSREELLRAGVDNLQALDGLLPGVSIIDGNGGVAGIFVRSVGQDDFLLSNDPGVGVYLDGVYLGRIFGNALDTIDTDRIEVLRGPQGTLYGRNSEAGTINIHSAMPALETKTSGEIWLGSRRRIDTSAITNIPLTPSSAIRVAVKLRHQDGYIHNLEGDDDAGNVNRQSARIAYRWDMPSGTRLLLSGDYYRQREMGDQYNLAGVHIANDPNQFVSSRIEFWNRAVAPRIGEEPLDDHYISPKRTTRSTTGLQSDVDHWGLNLTLDGTLGSSSWKSIFGLRHVTSAWGADYDRSPATLWVASVPFARQSQISEELRILGDAAPDLHYTAGAFFFRERANDHHIAGLPIGAMDALDKAAPHSIPAPGFAGLTCPNPDRAINLANCLGGSADVAPEAVERAKELQLYAPIYSFRHVTSLNAALYGQLAYTPDPKWELSAGLRLGYEAKHAQYRGYTPDDPSDDPPISRQLDWIVPTWALSLSYRPTDNNLIYLSWSRGYKAGGVNLRPLQGQTYLDSYEPETNTNLELGIKSQWLNDRVRLDLAAYLDHYDKFQDFTYSVVDDRLVSSFSNRANARSYGIEADLSIALTRELLLKTAFSLQGWKYNHITEGGDATLRLGQPRPALLPSSTVRTVLEWEKDTELGHFAITGDVRWRSSVMLDYDVSFTPGENPQPSEIREPAAAVVHLSAELQPHGSRTAYFFQVDNLFDRAYRTNYFDAAVIAELWNKPREWRVGLRHQF